MADPNPQRIGSYEILALLGDSGSGPVYHGLHSQLARPAAIKILRDDLAQDANVVRRFQREARIAAQLHHPNIVEIYDTGERDGFYYIARGLVDGQTLRQLLDERKPAFGETVRIARQIADALDHAHERGVIHRDLNPGGIVIDRRGQVTVIDFGIAGAVEDLIPVSGDPETMSSWFETPAYVAPEQATGQPALPASDIYALGAVVYEMLTGEPPFSGTDRTALLASLLRETPTPPSERNSSLPDGIDEVIMRALAKTPTDRYPTAAAFISDLTRVLGTGELPRARMGIPPIVLATPPAETSDAATPVAAPSEVVVPEPIVIERVVYRSRKNEPAVWYGVGTTLLAIALLLNLFWDNDDQVRADIGQATATATITMQTGAVDPTETVASTQETEVADPTEATSESTAEPTESQQVDPTTTVEPTPSVEPTPAEATPAPTETPLPPPSLATGGELILFTSDRDEVPGGMLITYADGGEQVPVFAEGAGFSNAIHYALSPDGDSLAFAAIPDGGDDYEIFVLNIAANARAQMTDAPGDDLQPRWSPNGNQIAFISHRDDNSEIYVMNADGSNPFNLSDHPGADYSHVWAPNGTRIAFGSNRTGDNEIFSVEPDGDDLENLTNHPDADWGPVWAPDGNSILFGSNRDGNDDVFVMRWDGSNPVNLTNDPAADNLAVWSPDGQWIAFVSDRDESSDVFVMAADGSDPRSIGATIEQEGSPAWSPDSSAIVYTQTIEGNTDIFVATLDDPTPLRITDDPGVDAEPLWVSLPQ